MSLCVLCNNHLFSSNLFASSLLNWGGLPTASRWYGPITYHVQCRWSAPITYHVNSFYVENVNIWFGFELTYCGDNLGCPRALNAVLGLCRGATRTGAGLRSCARRMYSLWSPSEAERDPPESEQLWSGLFIFPPSQQLEYYGSAVFKANYLIFCKHIYLLPQRPATHLSNQKKKEKILEHPFLACSGHFSGSQRLMISGSDTSVGTLHAILNKTKHQQFGLGESRTSSLPVQLVPSLKGAHGTCLTLVHFHSAH